MNKGDDRAGSKADILEPEPDVEQHTDRGDDHRNDRIHTHLGADGGADILCGNIFRRNTIIFIHILSERFTLLKIQSLRLKDNLGGILDRLYLDVRIPCDLFQIRDHLAVDLIQRIFLVECYIGRCSAHKIKTVVHGADASCMIDAHEHEAAQTHDNGDCKENLTFAHKIESPAFLEQLAVYFPVPDPHSIE